jgi:hypothetical protein
MFRLVLQIGIGNFSLIKALHIWVPCMATPSEWVQLLHLLAEKAVGLRYLEIAFGAELEWMCGRGLGDNQDIVRALGTIQGARQTSHQGLLRRNLAGIPGKEDGCASESFMCHCCEEREPKAGNLTDEELEEKRYVRERNEMEFLAYKKYQQKTEAWNL